MEKVYSLRQVAELTGMKIRTIREWVHNGKIEATKLENSRRWIVSESELRRLRHEDAD